VNDIWLQLKGLPLPVSFAFTAGATFCVIGGIVGLVIGLTNHAATAWFAVPEAAIIAGIPAAALGLAIGILASACRWLWRALTRMRGPSA